jgi:hypothetical protein
MAAGKLPSLSFRIFARLPGHPQMGPEADIYQLPQAEFKVEFADGNLAQ